MIEVNKKYNVIYADPPWKYGSSRTGRRHKHGASDHYGTTSLEDLKEFPITEITETDSILFMWATTPLLPEAVSLFSAWGFTYKTFLVWEKTGGLGMGRWLRVNTELILMGTKGEVKPFRWQERNIYKHPIGSHSQKPHFFRELVTKLASRSLAEPKKLELFARTRDGMFGDYEYEGWDVYGNEVNNSIKIP